MLIIFTIITHISSRVNQKLFENQYIMVSGKKVNKKGRNIKQKLNEDIVFEK